MRIYKVYLHKITIIAGDWDKRNAKQTHTTPLFHKKSSKGVKQISKKHHLLHLRCATYNFD